MKLRRLHPQNLAFLGIVLAVGLGALGYLSLSRSVYPDSLLMPLDDSYIHFQYARQMAHGQPYAYNPDGPQTSGATSLLYGPLLAIGYRLGFQGLDLSLWAVMLGVLAHTLSTWTIYRLIRGAESFNFIGYLLALAFGIGGPFIWAAVSGMETALFLTTVLLTLEAYRQERANQALLMSALAALFRPEGAVIVIGVLMGLVLRRRRLIPDWRVILAAFGAIATQPLLNLAMTGSATASGSLAKSHLYNPTLNRLEQAELIAQNFTQIWGELATGKNAVDGWYVAPLLTLPALFALLLSLRTSWRQGKISAGLLAGVWIVGLSLMIATLDTAFWHFKRYQLPMLALLFPLAGWLIVPLLRESRDWASAWAGLLLIFAIGTHIDFAGRYMSNIVVVRDQQLAMARWTAANLPRGALVAVHDVGVMRYMGGHDTYDVVGLTTPNQAEAWRGGPGTIYESLAAANPRPDYVAIYPDIQGLPLLIQAAIWGDELARFSLELPPHTVASATGTQTVAALNLPDNPRRPQDAAWLADFNIGHTHSEAAYGLTWDAPDFDGFSTFIQNTAYAGCTDCEITDAGRVVQSLEFDLRAAESYQIVMRALAVTPTRLYAGCDATQQIRVVPSLSGGWVDIPFTDYTEQRFCLRADQPFYPAFFRLYQAESVPVEAPPDEPLATFTDASGGTFDLAAYTLEQSETELTLNLTWWPTRVLEHDGKLFIHLYDDPQSPPILGLDTYSKGAYPPANWSSEPFDDQQILNLEGLPEGVYRLAIGFYDPTNGIRYTVGGEGANEDGRLFLADIEIPPAD